MIRKSSQKGAALMMVLLMIASLSFIVLAISETGARSLRRASTERALTEAFWIGVGAEALARTALPEALSIAGDRLTRENPLFAQVHALPLERGVGRIVFRDATRCYNLNALVSGASGGVSVKDEAAILEFQALLAALGWPGGEADIFVDTLVDWLDSDSLQEPRGAENDFYSALPSPYHTANAPIADVSELAALRGIDRERREVAERYFCAYPGEETAAINVNMLTPEDAPLLTALTKGELDLFTAQDLIAAIPPGGFADEEAFWSLARDRGFDAPQEIRSRIAMSSSFVAAAAEIEMDGVTLDTTFLFRVAEGGRPTLIAREQGGR